MASLTVNDEVFKQASEAAAARGKSLDEFVGEALQSALSRAGVHQTVRNGLPVMVINGSPQTVDPAKIRQCLEEEGF